MNLGPYALGPNDTPENGIYCGDARELAKAIPDESVDLIFADPVYQNIDDYRWLAECGARVLKDDRACLAYTGPGQLQAASQALVTGGLDYRTTAVLHWVGTNGWGSLGFAKWAAMIVAQKGAASRCKYMFDVKQFRPGGGKLPDPRAHRWGKPPDVIAYYLEGFVSLGAIIFDPFTGGGTVPAVCKMLGRRYLAFEIDAATCELARERVRNTQPPLFVAQEQQADLF